ncbi:class II aldolase/adducin family protein [Actinocorallia sp. A-T 12471]|uniref:class II aldolase/adducin family protein n=1 Tax=Actinocorallia sp. A-T 12471 TaxID=3089813 RepID=UPI0029D213D7|nr:class II aldolase/adducin family protein [Actinocorallia sp. A-T 12471]MDX6740188.1 class II aldolase/adducin family protein [Actinocorallia sp. A-T 12471]
MTPTGAAVRDNRWRVAPEDLVVMTPRGEVVERGRYASAASTVQVLMLLEAFPEVNAVIHTHARWSRVYAAAGLSLPPAITSMDRYGDVPCIRIDEHVLKARYREAPWVTFVPEAMNTSRPDIAAVNAAIAERAIELLDGRRDQFAWHGLGYTMYRHGLVVVSPSLERAVQDATAMESSCETALGVAVLQLTGADVNGLAVQAV